MKRFVQFPGRPELYPLFDTSGKRQTVTPIGTISRNKRFQSAYPEPLPELPTQRIE